MSLWSMDVYGTYNELVTGDYKAAITNLYLGDNMMIYGMIWW